MAETMDLLSTRKEGTSTKDKESTMKPFDQSSLKASLVDCLDNINTTRPSPIFETVSNPPNPGIQLRNGEIIGLPLLERDAEAIIAASQRAPIDKADNTTVQKLWEVSCEEFSVKNPAWEPFLRKVVTKVLTGLGIEATSEHVSAHPSKMILCCEGPISRPYQDICSEKNPGAFATLAIALPSKHNGGEAQIMHAGGTKILERAKSSEFDACLFAWFSNATQEIRHVHLGRRLILTYNLIHTKLGVKELAATSDANAKLVKLRTLLPRWRHGIHHRGVGPAMAYILDHQYTDASVSFDELKGKDRAALSRLHQVCKELKFSLYLANSQISVHGACYDDIAEVYCRYYELPIRTSDESEPTTKLKRVVNLDGSELVSNVTLKENILIQDNSFKNSEPSYETYSRDKEMYSGKLNRTRIYNRIVAIIVPTESCAEFFLRQRAENDTFPSPYTGLCSTLFNNWTIRLPAELTFDPTNQEVQEEFYRLIKAVAHLMRAWTPGPDCYKDDYDAPFSAEEISNAFKSALDLRHRGLFLDIYYACVDSPIGSVPFEALRHVATALVVFDLKFLVLSLGDMIRRSKSFALRYRRIEMLQKSLQDQSLDLDEAQLYQDWLKCEIERTVADDCYPLTTTTDGAALLRIARSLSSDEISMHILPVLKRNAHNTTMILTFLTGLQHGILRANNVHPFSTVIRRVISVAAGSFRTNELLNNYSRMEEQRSRFAIPSLTCFDIVRNLLC